MRDLGRVRGIRPQELQALRDAGVNTVEELWIRAGSDSGIAGLEALPALTRGRLVSLLVSEALREANSWETSFPSRHWPELTILLFAAIAVGLLVRALGGLAFLPSPLGLDETVYIATRDLDAGRTLEPSDFGTARLSVGANMFGGSTKPKLEGMILARSVPAGAALHFEDVLRLQVIALKDLRAAAIVGPGSAAAAWTAYTPPAALNVSDVIGRTARHPIRAGDVIVTSALDDDLRLGMIAPPAGLQDTAAPPSGATVAVTPTGRQLLRLPLPITAISARLTAGDRVSLLFTPTDRGQTPPRPIVLSDIAVASVERRPDTAMPAVLVVEVTPDDLSVVMPLLGASTVFVLQLPTPAVGLGLTPAPTATSAPPPTPATVPPTMPPPVQRG